MLICDNNNQKNDKRPICPRWSCLFGFIGVDICNYHVILWNNEWFSDTQNALSFALVRLCWLRRTWNSGTSSESLITWWPFSKKNPKLKLTVVSSSKKAASIFWYMCNKFLLSHPRSNGNDLEWGFCFGMDSNFASKAEINATGSQKNSHNLMKFIYLRHSASSRPEESTGTNCQLSKIWISRLFYQSIERPWRIEIQLMEKIWSRYLSRLKIF